MFIILILVKDLILLLNFGYDFETFILWFLCYLSISWIYCHAHQMSVCCFTLFHIFLSLFLILWYLTIKPLLAHQIIFQQRNSPILLQIFLYRRCFWLKSSQTSNPFRHDRDSVRNRSSIRQHASWNESSIFDIAIFHFIQILGVSWSWCLLNACW